MEKITIGQITSAIGIISLIATFISGIVVSISKWWKAKVTNKFTEIDGRIDKVEEDVDFLKDKKEKYEKIAQESKEERMILLEGLLACLKGLRDDLKCNGPVTQGIEKVEKYLIEKTHE